MWLVHCCDRTSFDRLILEASGQDQDLLLQSPELENRLIPCHSVLLEEEKSSGEQIIENVQQR